MSTIGRFLLGIIAIIAIVIGISWGMGWYGVRYTRTIGKAQQNADRTVYEESQSFIEGKRQELLKLHHEWVKADKDSKEAIEAVIRQSFANVNDTIINDPDLYNFLKQTKNK